MLQVTLQHRFDVPWKKFVMRISIIEPMALIDSAGNRISLTQKEKEVLAMLLANPEGCSRQVLQNTLWPTSSVDSRQVRLSQTLSKLRRGSASDLIYASDGNLRLRSSLSQTELGELNNASAAILKTPDDMGARVNGQQLWNEFHGVKLCLIACDFIPELKRQWGAAIQRLEGALTTPDDHQPEPIEQPTSAIDASVEAGPIVNHSSRLKWQITGLVLVSVITCIFFVLRPRASQLTSAPIVPEVRQVEFEQTIIAEDKERFGLPTNSESTALSITPAGGIYACGYMRTKDSDVDGFVMRVSPKGGIEWKTRLSGIAKDCDRAFSLLTENDGSNWVAGDTYVDKPIKNHGRLIEPGWHLIVWKISPSGKLLETVLGGFIAGESPRAAWLASDNVGGVWAAVQSRKPLGTVPELLHVSNTCAVVTNIQVGNQMFQLSSLATDRFGQVFLGGIEDGIVAGNHRMENYVICVDARGREVVRKPIGKIESRNTANLIVVPGPDDQMWIARTAQLADGNKYIVSLMSSSTFALTDVTSYSLSNPVQQVVASLSKSNHVADVATVETESNNGGKSVVFAPMSAGTRTTVLMPSAMMNQTIVPIHLDPVQTSPHSIICRVNPSDANKQNLLRFVLSDTSATVTSLTKMPAFIVTACTDSVCIGRVQRGNETHAIVLSMN